MRCIFFVALKFVVAHHLFQAIPAWRTRRYKRPAAYETSPSFHMRRFGPYHLPRSERSDYGALSRLLGISIDVGNQWALLATICNVFFRKIRLLAVRLRRRMPNRRCLFAIFLEPPVGRRRAFSATVMGTCSNRVFLTVMLASLISLQRR